MTSTIFISHSCKDHEAGPPAGLPPDEITARVERLSFARKLRDEVRTSLLEVDGLEVFLDVRGGLTAGDVWQDGLHQNLRSCAGAVLLLSPEALESDWVLKEATILSWRVFLGERLVLVPVLLGVSRNDLVARGFGAISLDAIQWIEVADASDAERRSAVQQIVAALEPVASFGVRSDRSIWRSTAERWLIETARQLKLAVPEGYDETYQTQMYRALGVEAQDRDRDGDDPYQNIATFLLTSDALSILQLLGEVPTDSTLQRDTLSKKVLPLWVEALAAAQLPQAARQGDLVAIDGDEVESAKDYVRRAYCTHILPDRLLAPSEATDGTTEDIVDKVEQALETYLPIDDLPALDKDIAKRGPVYVVLGPALTRAAAIQQLRTRYSQLTFVAVAGADPRKRLGSLADGALLLRPSLQPRKERSSRLFRNRLQAYVNETT